MYAFEVSVVYPIAISLHLVMFLVILFSLSTKWWKQLACKLVETKSWYRFWYHFSYLSAFTKSITSPLNQIIGWSIIHDLQSVLTILSGLTYSDTVLLIGRSTILWECIKIWTLIDIELLPKFHRYFSKIICFSW